jgi:hypothetical protein
MTTNFILSIDDTANLDLDLTTVQNPNFANKRDVIISGYTLTSWLPSGTVHRVKVYPDTATLADTDVTIAAGSGGLAGAYGLSGNNLYYGSDGSGGGTGLTAAAGSSVTVTGLTIKIAEITQSGSIQNFGWHHTLEQWTGSAWTQVSEDTAPLTYNHIVSGTQYLFLLVKSSSTNAPVITKNTVTNPPSSLTFANVNYTSSGTYTDNGVGAPDYKLTIPERVSTDSPAGNDTYVDGYVPVSVAAFTFELCTTGTLSSYVNRTLRGNKPAFDASSLTLSRVRWVSYTPDGDSLTAVPNTNKDGDNNSYFSYNGVSYSVFINSGYLRMLATTSLISQLTNFSSLVIEAEDPV